MFNSIIGASITLPTFVICVITSIVLGLIVAFLHMKTTKSNQNFISTLVLLPVIVTVVIVLVNGNLGTGVAVAGAFSLIRFRSIPGNSREILNVFFAMAIGLAVGTGYIGFAIVFTVLTAITSFILFKLKFGENTMNEKILKIAIPEELDYQEVFDDIFKEHLDSYVLRQTKTTNMGSMFELTYVVVPKEKTNEKELIDKIRVRNGNLKVSLTHPIEGRESL